MPVYTSNLSENGGLNVRVAGLVQLHAGKEVIDEWHEQWLVLVHQLRQVHVTQHSHDNRCLAVLGVGSLECSQCAQHGQNVTQSKVIVHLYMNVFKNNVHAKLLPTDLIQHKLNLTLIVLWIQEWTQVVPIQVTKEVNLHMCKPCKQYWCTHSKTILCYQLHSINTKTSQQ